MESQMVQNSRSKIVFTFNKFFIKVKRDFNQANQNQVTFNGLSFKVTAYFNQAQQQKFTHSTNFNSTPREYCVKLKKWAVLSFNEKFFSGFLSRVRSICLLGVQVAFEGEGWMVLGIDNYDSTGYSCSKADQPLPGFLFLLFKNIPLDNFLRYF